MHSAVQMKGTPGNKSKDHSSSIVRNLRDLFSPESEPNKSSLEHEVLKLSTRDSRLFIDALENPPEPSEGLLSVFE